MSDFSIIGKPIPALDAHLKVQGASSYVGDMVLPRLIRFVLKRFLV